MKNILAIIILVISIQVLPENQEQIHTKNQQIIFDDYSEKNVSEITEDLRITSQLPDDVNFFGYSISLDGYRLAIGAQYNSGIGVVFVFENKNGQWIETAQLLAEDGEPGDSFGHSIDLSNDHIIIGAPLDDYSITNNSGAAYIFEFKDENWKQQIKLTAVKDDSFVIREVNGISVAIDGNFAFVGGGLSMDANHASTSILYTYQLINGNWTLIQNITPDNTVDKIYFGRKIKLEDHVLVVSACCTINTQIPSGVTNSVYIYEYNGENWIEKTILKSNVIWDDFGFSIGVSNNTVVVGAPRHHDEQIKGIAPTGKVYIYKKINENYGISEVLSLPDVEQPRYFGYTVNMHENQLLIASKTGNQQLSNPRPVYLYKKSYNHWEKDKILRSSTQYDDDFDALHFGDALELNDKIRFIGSYRSSNRNGAVLVYNSDLLFNSGFEQDINK